jgi:hypothetical protein
VKIIPVGDFEFRMKPDDAEKVYEILVKFAGFQDTDRNRQHFVLSMREGSSEYRFQGSLGVGGKYLIEHNVVSCYSDDLNDERFNIIRATNQALRDYHELSGT